MIQQPTIIAEDARIEAGENFQIHLIGAFSAVFLTLASFASKRMVLIPPGVESEESLATSFGYAINNTYV